MVESKTVVGLVTLAFLIVIIGVVILNEASKEVIKITDTVGNIETLSLAPARGTGGTLDVDIGINLSNTAKVRGTWKESVSDCLISTVEVRNSTTGVLTEGTACTTAAGPDYVRNASEQAVHFCNTLDVNNSIAGSNTTYVAYSYCGPGYQTGFSSTIMDLVPGFFGLAIMVSIAFMIYWIAKKEGIEL